MASSALCLRFPHAVCCRLGELAGALFVVRLWGEIVGGGATSKAGEREG